MKLLGILIMASFLAVPVFAEAENENLRHKLMKECVWCCMNNARRIKGKDGTEILKCSSHCKDLVTQLMKGK